MKPQKQVSDIPNAADRHLWQIQPVRDAAWILVALGVLWLGYAMRSVTVPLLVALLLAYLFEPVISVMQRRLHLPRTVAVGSVLGVGGIALLLAIGLTVPLVVGQTASFVGAVKDGKYDGAINHAITWAPDSIQPELETFVGKAGSLLGLEGLEGHESGPAEETTGSIGATVAEDSIARSPDEGSPPGATAAVGTENVDSLAAQDERIRAIVREELAARTGEGAIAVPAPADPEGLDWFGIVGSGVQRVWGVILGIIQISLLTFLIPFYFFMFSAAWPKVLGFGKGMIMEAHRDRTVYLLQEMDKAVSGFVRGRIVICAILAVCYAVGWTIVGVPYAIPLGIIVGVFTLVPYLGGIGLPISVGLLFADQFSVEESQRMAWWAIIVWPSVVFLVSQFLDDYLLTPLIAGKATNLDPVTIVVAILAGGALAGLYGMLIAIPVAACIKILLREVLMPRIRDWIAGRVDDPLPIEE